jgi:hypothetical protein
MKRLLRTLGAVNAHHSGRRGTVLPSRAGLANLIHLEGQV